METGEEKAGQDPFFHPLLKGGALKEKDPGEEGGKVERRLRGLERIHA